MEIIKISKENDLAKEKLDLILRKKNVVRSLDQELGMNPDKENFVRNYLPEGKNEEKIINAVNFLAASSGVSLIDISVKKDTINEIEKENIPSPDERIFNFSQDGGEEIQAEMPVYFKSISFEISVAGKYENIKAFLSGMGKLEAMNKIKSASIYREEDKTKKEGEVTPADILSSKILSEFFYLEKIQAGGNYGLRILNSDSFDFSQVDKIKQFISQGTSVLESGEKGNNNPFFAF